MVKYSLYCPASRLYSIRAVRPLSTVSLAVTLTSSSPGLADWGMALVYSGDLHQHSSVRGGFPWSETMTDNM